VFVLRIVMSITYCVLCVCFVLLRLVHLMVPVSLDCLLFIYPSVFSNVYILHTVDMFIIKADNEMHSCCILTFTIDLSSWFC